MSRDDYDYHAYGAGGSYHPLEDVGGFGSFEKGIGLTLLFLPIVAGQFLTIFFTIIGVMLAADGNMSQALYGPFANPYFTAFVGVVVWVFLRYLRLGIIHLCGGGLIPRSKLYREEGRG